MLMDLTFIPRARIVTALQDGWRLVPGHDYEPGDYAILMYRPDQIEALPIDAVLRIAGRFDKPARRPTIRNTSASPRRWRMRGMAVA